MTRLTITAIGLLLAGIMFGQQTLDAQSERALQVRPENVGVISPQFANAVKKNGKTALISFTMYDDGTVGVLETADAKVRDMTQPVPSGVSDIDLLSVYVYEKNSHCYSYPSGSGWKEVCPPHS